MILYIIIKYKTVNIVKALKASSLMRCKILKLINFEIVPNTKV